MEPLVFQKHPMTRLIKIRNIITVHYLKQFDFYSTPAHKHDAWELVVCLDGLLEVWEDGTRTLFRRGEARLHRPRSSHCIQIGGAPTTAFLMAFSCSDECLKLLSGQTFSLGGEQRQLLTMLIRELCSTFRLKNRQLLLQDFVLSPTAPIGAEQLVCGYLEHLLITLLRGCIGRNPVRVDAQVLEIAMENRIVAELKKYINSHLDTPLSVELLSQHSHYSRAYLSAIFKQGTGSTILAYISEKRMERAKELLRQGTWSISRISDALGFSSVQYFSRRFRQEVGCSPTDYRRSLDGG